MKLISLISLMVGLFGMWSILDLDQWWAWPVGFGLTLVVFAAHNDGLSGRRS